MNLFFEFDETLLGFALKLKLYHNLFDDNSEILCFQKWFTINPIIVSLFILFCFRILNPFIVLVFGFLSYSHNFKFCLYSANLCFLKYSMEFWNFCYFEHANQEITKVIQHHLNYNLIIINWSFNLETLKFFQTSFDFDKSQRDSFAPIDGILITF